MTQAIKQTKCGFDHTNDLSPWGDAYNQLKEFIEDHLEVDEDDHLKNTLFMVCWRSATGFAPGTRHTDLAEDTAPVIPTLVTGTGTVTRTDRYDDFIQEFEMDYVCYAYKFETQRQVDEQHGIGFADPSDRSKDNDLWVYYEVDAR